MSMADSYLKRLVSKHPEIIGKELFCSPPALPYEVICQLNADGTISPCSNLSKSFTTPLKLIQEMCDPNWKRVGASRDLFFKPGRKERLDSFVRRQQPRTKRKCIGFKVGPFNGNGYITSGRKMQIRLENKDYRSAQCYGFVRSKRGNVCSQCAETCNAVASYRRSLQQDRLLCYGLKRSKFEAVIAQKQWEGERRDVSLVTCVGNRLFARGCNGQKAEPTGKFQCLSCRKLRSSLALMAWRSRRRKAADDTPRLLWSRVAYLSVSDRERKEKLLRRRREEKAKKLRAQAAKAKRELRRASKFIPNHPENRQAVASMVAHLDAETDRFKNPICQWTTDNGECGHRAQACQRLLAHLNDVHLGEQKERNRPQQPLERQYHCRWKNCKRQRPFNTWKNVYDHLKEHSGTAETERRLETLRNQMINANRSRTGRRHTQAAKDLVMAKYRSRKSWQLACDAAGLPMVSGKTIRAMKNAGGASTGIDVATIERMKRIARNRPFLQHGLLVCDEVYVRPSVSFHSGSRIVYGYADDSRGELATKLLVFQYVSLLSKRRFRANVAVFACAKKATAPEANILEWFLQVGDSLESHGFHLHGLVCDGDAKNRGLQNQLSALDAYGDENTVADSGIVHPFTSNIRRFYLLSDPTHCVKKFRNSWCNKRRSLKILMPPSSDQQQQQQQQWRAVSWAHTVAVFEFQQNQLLQGFRIDRQLTQAHVDVENYEKMNLKTAVDVISTPIEKAMEDHVPGSEGTRHYMQLVRIFWQAMNQKRAFFKYEDTAPLRQNLEFVGQALTAWYNASRNRSSEFITSECYQDAMRVCKAVPCLIDQLFHHLHAAGVKPRFIPKLVTQDLLERDFGSMHQACGGAMNPPVQAAIYGLKTRNASLLLNFAIKCPANASA